MLRLFSFLFLAACATEATENTFVEAPDPAQSDSLIVYQFPEDWTGIWSGDLRILSTEGLQQTVPMSLEILPQDTSDRWTYNLIYGEDRAAGLRAYELEPIDPARGRWAIDERNSIRMEAYQFENQIVQRFEVMGNMLETIMELYAPDELRWEILSGSMEAVSTTGDQVFEGEEIPPVKTYPIRVRQTAVLRREID